MPDDYNVDLEGWPELPPTRVIGSDHLMALRGRPVHVVHHYCLNRYNRSEGARPTGLAEATVYDWIVGPLVVFNSKNHRDRWFNYELDMEQDIRDGQFDLYLSENGDWDNELRNDMTFLRVRDFNVLDRSHSYPCNAIFETKRDAELWAIQVKLSFLDPMEESLRSQRRGMRFVTPRKPVKQSLARCERHSRLLRQAST